MAIDEIGFVPSLGTSAYPTRGNCLRLAANTALNEAQFGADACK